LISMIAYVIAGVAGTAFIALWFFVSYCKLAERYHEVKSAKEQIKLHQAIFRQDLDRKNIQVAKRMLETSRMIYWESVNDYNRVYTNPFYHIPGLMLGFRLVSAVE